jgi:prepilin-type processing-associated H-X9-DG protein
VDPAALSIRRPEAVRTTDATKRSRRRAQYVDAGGGGGGNVLGGVNRNATGMAMNWWPNFRGDYPRAADLNDNGFPVSGTKAKSEKFVDPTGNGADPERGTWWKLAQFSRPGERALLADGRQFYLEAKKVASAADIPGQRLNFIDNDYTTGMKGQTTFDFYRHGTYPGIENANKANGHYKASGGRVGYNILFADNHVAAPTDREAAYRSVRMRFPE